MAKKDTIYEMDFEDFKGFIPVPRGLYALLEVSKFSRFEAVCDLLNLITRPAKPVTINGKRVRLKENEAKLAVSFLAKRWNWNRKSVDLFTDWLEDKNIIKKRVYGRQGASCTIFSTSHEFSRDSSHDTSHEGTHDNSHDKEHANYDDNQQFIMQQKQGNSHDSSHEHSREASCDPSHETGHNTKVSKETKAAKSRAEQPAVKSFDLKEPKGKLPQGNPPQPMATTHGEVLLNWLTKNLKTNSPLLQKITLLGYPDTVLAEFTEHWDIQAMEFNPKSTGSRKGAMTYMNRWLDNKIADLEEQEEIEVQPAEGRDVRAINHSQHGQYTQQSPTQEHVVPFKIRNLQEEASEHCDVWQEITKRIQHGNTKELIRKLRQGHTLEETRMMADYIRNSRSIDISFEQLDKSFGDKYYKVKKQAKDWYKFGKPDSNAFGFILMNRPDLAGFKPDGTPINKEKKGKKQSNSQLKIVA